MISGYLVVVLSLVGAAVAVVARQTQRGLTTGRRFVWIIGSVLGIAGLAFGTIWAFFVSGPGYELPEGSAMKGPVLDAPDPGEPGRFGIQTLTYGSGTDRRRPEFGSNASLTVEPVDGRPFLDGWEGLSGWYRTRYWGFDQESLPLNGRVWYPDEEGRFPLVLIVHGNHNMADVSDTGYAYLGELLASRGYITVSVDQNFLNSGLSDVLSGLDGENDARAWLLLEQLRVWHEWNALPGHEFYQRIDTDRIALIGHSRGGEAVAIASMFNALPAYPDDATVQFDYGYEIQSVVAIAPVDGQYFSGHRPTELSDVSFLALHGSADSDVFWFMGAQQYDRVETSEDSFRAAVYVHGANHGQFNSSWGRSDQGWPGGWLINLNELMPAENQKRIARTFVSGFLEATLGGDGSYRQLFIEPGSGREFLPESVILSQYADYSGVVLSSFEEDVDVTTATRPGASWEGRNLTLWKEQRPQTKTGEALRSTTVSYVGWDRSADGTAAAATFGLTLEDPLQISRDDALSMAAAFPSEDPSPDNESTEGEETEPASTLDFSVMITDTNGQAARVQLSDFAIIYAQGALGYRIDKTPLPSQFAESELVLDTVRIPMARFAEVNERIDLSSITLVQFVFDRTEAGVLALDDVLIARSPDAAWL